MTLGDTRQTNPGLYHPPCWSYRNVLWHCSCSLPYWTSAVSRAITFNPASCIDTGLAESPKPCRELTFVMETRICLVPLILLVAAVAHPGDRPGRRPRRQHKALEPGSPVPGVPQEPTATEFRPEAGKPIPLPLVDDTTT